MSKQTKKKDDEQPEVEETPGAAPGAAPDAPEHPEAPETPAEAPEAAEQAPAADEGDPEVDEGDDEQPGEDDEQPEGDTFPREYVEELRREAAAARVRAQQADVYAERLHVELVRQLGALADPTDLPFDPEHLDDPEKLRRDASALLMAKPHLAARVPRGNIGQGYQPEPPAAPSLTGMLRAGVR